MFNKIDAFTKKLTINCDSQKKKNRTFHQFPNSVILMQGFKLKYYSSASSYILLAIEETENLFK